MATLDTAGAFLGNWRKMTIDGLEWDVPDTPQTPRRFDYPVPGGRRAGSVSQGQGSDDRRVRVGAPVLAPIGPCTSKGGGEQSLAREALPALLEEAGC